MGRLPAVQGKPYDPETIQKALTAVILNATTKEAHEQLKREGVEVHYKTLLKWVKHDRVHEYHVLKAKLAPKIEERLTTQLLDNASLAARVERKGIERAEEHLDAGNVSDPARVARDISQVKSQELEKMMSLQGRPQQVTERRAPEEIIRQLEALGVVKQVDVESTAE